MMLENVDDNECTILRNHDQRQNYVTIFLVYILINPESDRVKIIIIGLVRFNKKYTR